jgi:ankyrin repeat protein/outer membrane protein assembly factor BamB
MALATSAGAAKPKDVLPEVAEAARQYAPFSGPVAWESETDVEAADLIEFVGPDRVLVGTVAVTSKIGNPEHGPLYLFDARSGRQLWSAPRSVMPAGQYSLLAKKPLLVLAGRDDKVIEVFGLDLATGSKPWTVRATLPAEVQVVGNNLLVLSETERTLRCIDLASGTETWKQVLPTELSVPGISLAAAGNTAFVIGPSVAGFEMSSGQRRWLLDRTGHSYGAMPLSIASGLVLWGPQGVALVDVTNGNIVWEHPSPEQQTIQDVQAGGGSLYMVSDGPAMADDIIEARDEATGKPRWSKPLEDEAAGPPMLHGDLVCLTGDTAVLALRKTNGAKVFRTPFSPAFRAARPSAAVLLGMPDQLLVRNKTLVVWRERVGLQAFSLAGGAVLWTQTSYGDTPEFTYDGAALLIKTTKDSLNVQQQAYNKRMGALNYQIRDLQNQAEYAKTQQGSYVATAFSILAAGQVWREACRQAANQGLAQRFILWADAILRRPTSAIQGRYFIDPFIAKGVGRGVTVVDLDRGLRSDFLYSPIVAPLLDYSVDLLAFTFDPTQTQLLAVGVGFVPERHKPIEKWGFRLPRPSLFAFDVEKLHFEARNVMREKMVSAYDKLLLEKLGSGPEALPNAAAGGLTTQVAMMLDAGADPNSLYPGAGQTSLHLAVFNGHLAVVELLIKRGADVNRKDNNAKTPLDYAMMLVAGESGPALAKRQAIADMLRAAGGRQGTGEVPAKTAQNPAADLHNAIQSNDEPAFLEALKRGASIEGVYDNETPLTRALRERRTRIVAELRRRGCSLTAPGAYGLTPLHYAAVQLDMELIRACLAAKADVNTASTRGETPLMTIIRPYTVFGGEPMLQAVELLLTSGADPNRKEIITGKQTLLQVAKTIDQKLAQLLAQYGAK